MPVWVGSVICTDEFRCCLKACERGAKEFALVHFTHRAEELRGREADRLVDGGPSVVVGDVAAIGEGRPQLVPLCPGGSV